MLRSERNALRSNFVLLVKEIPCQEILAYLYQDGILSEQVVSEILEEPTSKRNYALLFILQRRGPRAFQSFIQALKQCKRQDLVNALSEFENNFSKLSI
jgi:hypothetical protein